MGIRGRQEKARREIFVCLGASEAMGKGDQEDSNAARLLYVNPGDKQVHERRGFQGLLCFQLQPEERMSSRGKGSWILSVLRPEKTFI